MVGVETGVGGGGFLHPLRPFFPVLSYGYSPAEVEDLKVVWVYNS